MLMETIVNQLISCKNINNDITHHHPLSVENPILILSECVVAVVVSWPIFSPENEKTKFQFIHFSIFEKFKNFKFSCELHFFQKLESYAYEITYQIFF